jgi:hypothetical protein
MPRFRAVVLAALFLMLPSALAAQQFTLGLYGGLYDATNDLYDQVETDVFLRFGQKIGGTVGARIAVWPSDRIGIELEASGVSSDVRIRLAQLGNAFIDTTFSGSLFMGSLNVVWAFIKPPLEPLAVYLSGGVGVVSRSGSWIDDFMEPALESVGGTFDKPTDIAGVIGLGLKYSVARHFNIRGDFKDYISSYKEDDLVGDARIQNDIQLTIGIEYFFGGS